MNDVPTIDMRENELSDWEWMTLVGAWRYYEYRSTMASATFPNEIVLRYWGSGRYGKAVQMRIARQFAVADHGSRGEKDWERLPDCDRIPWTKFYAFCKGVRYGFLEYRAMDGGRVCKGECFRCETTGRLYPVWTYIHNPYIGCYLGEGAQICYEKKEG